jgi:hypothetical protein
MICEYRKMAEREKRCAELGLDDEIEPISLGPEDE